MAEPDCPQSAQDYLDASDREFAAGNRRPGSALLYEAAVTAIRAIARQRGWPAESHRELTYATVQLAESEESDDGYFMVSGFAVAKTFRDNADKDFMEEYEIAIDGPAVHAYVRRLIAIAEAGAAG